MAGVNWALLGVAAALGGAGVYLLMQEKRVPFAVGDRVQFIADTRTGTVTRVLYVPEQGWVVDVAWDNGTFDQGLMARFLFKL